LAIAGLCLLGAALGQNLQQTVPAAKFDDVDLREALRTLAKKSGFTYSVSPSLQGQVTCDIKKKPLLDVLLQLLDPLRGSFVMEGGILQFEAIDELENRPLNPAEFREKPLRASLTFKNTGTRDALEVLFRKFGRRFQADPNLSGHVTYQLLNATFPEALETLLDAINGMVWIDEKGAFQIRARPATLPRRQLKLVTLDLTQTDVREALRQLLNQAGITYSIGVDVQGEIDLHVKNVPFIAALNEVLDQVRGAYMIEGGIYEIVLKPRSEKPGSSLWHGR